MEVDMRRRTIVLAACAAALVASLVIGPAATAKPDAASAGTVVIGADQEPVTLNFYLTEGNSYTTSLAVSPMLAAGMVYNQNAKLVPFLFDGEPKVLKSNPLTVSFKYKESAKWSDGRPLTGNDFLATYRTIMEEGTSADRQLATWKRTGDFKDVVDQLIRETAEGVV